MGVCQTLGQVPLEQALKRKTVRLGNKVKNETGGKSPILPVDYELILGKGGKKEVSKRMIHLAKEIGKLRNLPSYIDVAAALVLAFGLEKDQLLPWLNAARCLKLRMNPINGRVFEGRINRLVYAAPLHLLPKI